MEKQQSSDKFARLISIISLFVAISAVGLSFWQYHHEKLEKLSLIVNPHINRGMIKLTNHDFGQFGKVVQVPWQLIISNTGSRKLSIVNFNLWRAHSNTEPAYIESAYAGINGGLYKIDGNRIEFPLIIDSGESRLLTAYVGVLADPVAFGILKRKFKDKHFKMIDAVRVLGNEGKDILGNKAKLYEFDGGRYHLWVDPNDQKISTFIFEIYTGSGNQFGSAVPYYQ